MFCVEYRGSAATTRSRASRGVREPSITRPNLPRSETLFSVDVSRIGQLQAFVDRRSPLVRSQRIIGPSTAARISGMDFAMSEKTFCSNSLRLQSRGLRTLVSKSIRVMVGRKCDFDPTRQNLRP